ncbi:LysM peptidoglycan-binding domain-containing protein [Neobacillus drentensis]|uniref:LysM peptidoglycan-binding domain-containing protein n=1 Tax=Neobacillus drentensis TaxID=220684 RepID=UPI002FFFEAD0
MHLRKMAVVLLAGTLFCTTFKSNQANAASNEVPIEKVFQSMGYKVEKIGGSIYISREKDDRIRLKPKSRSAVKNGKKFILKKPISYDKKLKKFVISVYDVYWLAKEDNKEKHYRVEKGDTLSSIAKHFNTTTDNLKEWNNLKSNLIVPGQHLHIKDPVYIVQPGDSIWEIAHKTENTMDDIISLNDLTMQMVFPGQKLILPLQPSLKPPNYFSTGVFPLAQETYDPFAGGFGDGRSFSIDGKARRHEGIDIMATKWVPVFSATEGVVDKIGWNTLGGYRVLIKAKNGMRLYYAHFMQYAPGLKKGQKVSKGQLIGFVGNTGYGKKGTNGKFLPHLHFGIYGANGKAIDPYPYMQWWEIQP